jgi:peptidoglycan/LPS O-acetylase OafA/YrhL
VQSSTSGEARGVNPQPMTGARTAARLDWLDGAKGISILWIVFFHFFNTYTNSKLASPVAPHFFATFFANCAHSTPLAVAGCAGESLFVGLSYLGFHAVAVFLVASGFGLTYSLAGRGNPAGGWKRWYRARVIRLYPMYWLAHLVFLVAPFQFKPEPIDYRFWLSLAGDRVYPLSSIFYYANSAWWYFSLILQLYLVFPFLFRLLQKTGIAWFLILCALETVLSRYLILAVLGGSSRWVQGGFFGCRLWEFALGMALGLTERKSAGTLEALILSPRALVFGVAIYGLGLYSYGSAIANTVTDALTGTGLFFILCNLASVSDAPRGRLGAALVYAGTYSYGLYLLHESFVIYLGIRMRWMSMPTFVASAFVIIALMAVVWAQIERFVNDLTNRILNRGVNTVVPAAARESR